MRQLLFFLLILLLLTRCTDQQPKKLEEAFLLSVGKNDFDLLKSFLPDRDFYVSQVSKGNESDDEIKEIVARKNEELSVAWQNTIYNVVTKKIDLSKVMIKEVVYHDPFPNDSISEAMTVNYEYKGSTWDDIQFIVSRKTGKTILLSIPYPTRAFSMYDKDLRATNEARIWLEIGGPEFKKNLNELTMKMIAAAKSNNPDEFGQYLLYRGDDEKRKWKTPLNMHDSLDRQYAIDLMKRVHDNMKQCDAYQTGNIITKRETEGVWLTWPMNCGNKIVTLSFMKVNGKLLLVDTDIEYRQPAQN
jgi:hypothetical protein